MSHIHKRAYIYVLLAALLWGSTASVVKLLGLRLNNVQILFYTSAIACLGLFVIALAQNKLPNIKTYRPSDYLRFAYLAFLGVFLYYFLLYQALHLIPGQEAFTVNYTWPIWTVVFAAILLKERVNLKRAVALLISFMGVVLVITKGTGLTINMESLYGNILAILAAVCYGLFSVLTKKFDYEKVTSTMFYYFFSFIYVAIYLFAVSQFTVPAPNEWLGLIWLGLLTSGAAFVLWQLAIKHGDVSKMSNAILVTPFISLVYLKFLANEEIGVHSLLGALLIVSGIILQRVFSIKRTSNKT